MVNSNTSELYNIFCYTFKKIAPFLIFFTELSIKLIRIYFNLVKSFTIKLEFSKLISKKNLIPLIYILGSNIPQISSKRSLTLIELD